MMLFSLSLTGQVFAQETAVTFKHGRILTISGGAIADGTFIVKEGKIRYVGSTHDAPEFVGKTIDLQGKVIMPGLVCSHSHIGGRGGGDRSHPIQPETRIVDAINVRDPGFKRAIAGGLTTLNIMPGSGHLCSGQTAYVKCRKANTIDDLLIRDAQGRMLGGLKMANGTNPQKKAPFPQTRGKSAYLIRQKLIDAQTYQAKIRKANGDLSKMPPRNLALEVLVEALEGKRTIHHHTHRHDDILTVIRMAQEFKFPLVLQHVSGGWRIAEEIAASGFPCSINLLDSPAGKMESENKIFITGGVLERAGVLVAYHTDDPVTDSRWFLRCAALGVRGGMSRAGALKAVTLNPAKMLNLDERIGSLEVGKDADFIILSGDPFSIRTHVLETWVEGEQVFDLSNPDHRLYATGGYGAGSKERGYMCCIDEAQTDNDEDEE
jgi:imidazolonepropionase-like amidohydrolase